MKRIDSSRVLAFNFRPRGRSRAAIPAALLIAAGLTFREELVQQLEEHFDDVLLLICRKAASVPIIRTVPSIRKRKMTHLTGPGVAAVLASSIHQPVPPPRQPWTTVAQGMLVVPLQERF